MSSEIDLTSIQVDSHQSPSTVFNHTSPSPSVPSWMNLMPDFTVGERIAQEKEFDKSLVIAKTPKTPKAPKESKPKLTSDETIDRRRLILILQFYVLEFPEKLKPYKGTNFEKFKDDELQNLKNEFDFIIGANNVYTVYIYSRCKNIGNVVHILYSIKSEWIIKCCD